MAAPGLDLRGLLRPGEKQVFFAASAETEAEALVALAERQKGKGAEVTPALSGPERARAIRDPGLSGFGERQAAIIGRDWMLRPALAAPGGDELLVISPLRRVICTAQIAFGGWLSRRAAAGRPVPVEFSPDIPGCSDAPCDAGRSATELRMEFAEKCPHFRFDTLPENWHERHSDDSRSLSALAARLARFTQWVQQRPERTIIVMTHHSVIAHMLDVVASDAEIRMYAIGAAGEAADSCANPYLPLTPPWRAAWPPALPARSQLVCATSYCPYHVHSSPEFGIYCCFNCSVGRGHGPRCERISAPPEAKKLDLKGGVVWTQQELAEALASSGPGEALASSGPDAN